VHVHVDVIEGAIVRVRVPAQVEVMVTEADPKNQVRVLPPSLPPTLRRGGEASPLYPCSSGCVPGPPGWFGLLCGNVGDRACFTCPVTALDLSYCRNGTDDLAQGSCVVGVECTVAVGMGMGGTASSG